MAQQLDPGEWGRDIAKAERRVEGRRTAERRRRDRWGHYLDRVAIATLVVLYMLAVHRLQDEQHRLADQQRQITAVIATQKVDRHRSVAFFCVAINRLETTLRGLIIEGTKASRPLEPAYIRLGLPPYKQRLREAEQAAAKIRPLNCPRLLVRTAP